MWVVFVVRRALCASFCTNHQINHPKHRPPPTNTHTHKHLNTRHQISLYAHVAKLAFALDSVDAPVVRGTISDPASGVVSALAIEPAAEDAFDVADRIWEAL